MKNELKTILVPTDFQNPSIEAIEYAADICKKINGNIILLHILETRGIVDEFLNTGDNLVKITEQAKDKLWSIAKSVSNKYPEIKIETRVERGKPYQEILDVAGEIDPRMVIIGENHQGKQVEKHLGSTVYHVTLKSPAPVLTLKSHYKKMAKKIVVPLDLTREHKRKLYSAIAYAKNYDAEIHLVSVLIAGIKMEESLIYKKLKEAHKTLVENDIKTTCELFGYSKETAPYQRVLKYAHEIKADMILVMTHKEGYTYDNYIGAFAHHIINQSDIPVLSLTSTASKVNINYFLKDFVDPAGIFKTKS
ncbi:MAG: universal stress protein [Bacteroidales bacterium]